MIFFLIILKLLSSLNDFKVQQLKIEIFHEIFYFFMICKRNSSFLHARFKFFKFAIEHIFRILIDFSEQIKIYEFRIFAAFLRLQVRF